MGKFVPIVLIAVSAALWGIIAIFVRNLANIGFTPMEIVTLRVVSAAVLLGLIGILKYKEQLKIRFSDTRYFIGTGVFSIVLFNWCYFTSINQMSLSFAVILLYTAPAFVVVLSYFFLKEKLDRWKIISVLGTLTGCVLIAGVGVFETTINQFGRNYYWAGCRLWLCTLHYIWKIRLEKIFTIHCYILHVLSCFYHLTAFYGPLAKS